MQFDNIKMHNPNLYMRTMVQYQYLNVQNLEQQSFGNRAVLHTVLDAFTERFPSLLYQFQDAYKSGNRTQISALCGSLKSIFVMFSYEFLAHALEEIEMNCQAFNGDELTSRCNQIINHGSALVREAVEFQIENRVSQK